MKKAMQKTTLYLNPKVRTALKKQAVDTRQSMSEYVNRAVARAIAEDLEDRKDIKERRTDQAESLDAFLAALKVDGSV